MTKLMMLRKKRSGKAKALTQARARRKQLRADEQDLQQQVDNCEEVTEELETQVNQNADDLAAVEDEIAALQDEIDDLDQQIADLGADAGDEEDEEETGAAARGSAGPNRAQRRAAARTAAPESRRFNCRSRCFETRAQRDAFYRNENVSAFLGRVRSRLGAMNNAAGSRRSVTGAELGIPTEVLDVLRDNVDEYSKLLKHVRTRQVRGHARQQIIGESPEGIWMEMSGKLNELNFTISEVEVDGFKVGGVIILDNYFLEDSDIALGEEILYQLGQAIGMATDKSIPYGKGKSRKMPLGFVTRLAQTAEPEDWGDKRRAWKDLHTSNVLKLNLLGETGTSFFTTLLAALAKAKTRGTQGERVWIMNEATRLDILIRSLGVDAAAAIVAGMNNTMPIIGGAIETEEFMPDYTIAGGCLEAYLSVEREGGTFDTSKDALFIEDKTAFKGTARRDGLPIFDEDFVVVSYNNTDPVTELDFSYDAAGAGLNALIITAAAGTKTGDTKLTVAGAAFESPTLVYKVGTVEHGVNAGLELDDSWTALPANTNVTAAAGVPVTVIELDADKKVVSLGVVASVPKA